MKPIRHILLSLAALACVLPTSAQTARKTKTCTASDMVLIYAGGARNRNWSVDRMKDYVSYTDRDGKAHWLFDGFLLLEIRDIGPGSAEVAFDPGHKNEDGSILPAATQADWLKLIDYYFSEGQVIDAIERSGRGGVADARRSALETADRRLDPQPDRLQAADRPKGRHDLLGRHRQPRIGLFGRSRPRTGLPLVYRPSAEPLQAGQVPACRTGRILLG